MSVTVTVSVSDSDSDSCLRLLLMGWLIAMAAFDLCDLDQSGVLTLDELLQCLRAIGLAKSDAHVRHHMQLMDPNGDGCDAAG